jgi:hypothetical protein
MNQLCLDLGVNISLPFLPSQVGRLGVIPLALYNVYTYGGYELLNIASVACRVSKACTLLYILGVSVTHY